MLKIMPRQGSLKLAELRLKRHSLFNAILTAVHTAIALGPAQGFAC
jgi:hypothetical protein